MANSIIPKSLESELNALDARTGSSDFRVYPSAGSDLNTFLTNHTTCSLSLAVYTSIAGNKPTGNSGILITQGNRVYRGQLAIDLAGKLYTRTYVNGTISAWTEV